MNQEIHSYRPKRSGSIGLCEGYKAYPHSDLTGNKQNVWIPQELKMGTGWLQKGKEGFGTMGKSINGS